MTLYLAKLMRANWHPMPVGKTEVFRADLGDTLVYAVMLPEGVMVTAIDAEGSMNFTGPVAEAVWNMARDCRALIN